MKDNSTSESLPQIDMPISLRYDLVMTKHTIATPAHRFIDVNGVSLHVVQAGPDDGPLLIFLHGFPEYWRGWKQQIPYFATAAYRVWVPDQRGYNLSAKPSGLDAYNLDSLADDVIGLIDAAGAEKAFLVGHDWGGAVAWWTANKYPTRINRLGILNVPHHNVLRRYMRQHPRQLSKSWYMFFFQVPWFPERLMRAANYHAMMQSMKRSSLPGTFAAADFVAYREAWAQPGALTAMINWYRALFQTQPSRLPSSRITVPTLIIWGKQDQFLAHEMVQPSIDLCDNGRYTIIEKASHWVQHEAPDRVNQLLHEFFQES